MIASRQAAEPTDLWPLAVSCSLLLVGLKPWIAHTCSEHEDSSSPIDTRQVIASRARLVVWCILAVSGMLLARIGTAVSRCTIICYLIYAQSRLDFTLESRM